MIVDLVVGDGNGNGWGVAAPDCAGDGCWGAGALGCGGDGCWATTAPDASSNRLTTIPASPSWQHVGKIFMVFLPLPVSSVDLSICEDSRAVLRP
jgi:hypothetical protein